VLSGVQNVAAWSEGEEEGAAGAYEKEEITRTASAREGTPEAERRKRR
jgi:hypothetical protein